MDSALHDDIATRLQRARQRYTPARRALVELLRRVERPHTTQELLDAAPAMSQSSLYRNLAVLEDARVVRRLASTDDAARFELAEDVTGDHHHHLVCRSCGTIEDVELPPDLEHAIDRAADDVHRAQRFAIVGHSVELFGTCEACL